MAGVETRWCFAVLLAARIAPGISGRRSIRIESPKSPNSSIGTIKRLYPRPSFARPYENAPDEQEALSSRLVPVAGLWPEELALDLAGRRCRPLDDARPVHRPRQG